MAGALRVAAASAPRCARGAMGVRSPAMKLAPRLPGALVLAVLGCSSPDPVAPADAGRPVNDLGPVDVPTATDAAAPVDAAVLADVPTPPPWPRELPVASIMGDARGYTAMRTIIHAHSVHSHDACDGMPYVDGGPNLPCLQDFRTSLCTTKIDVMFLTEHAERIGLVPYETVLQMQPGDEPITDNGQLVGSRITCPDGHRVMVFPGAENELMPLALRRHPTVTQGTLEDTYHTDGDAGAALFRAAGATLAVAHCEERTIEYLRDVNPEVVELYNIHANLDPRIAGPYLNYNVGPAYADLLRFQHASNGLDAEWMFLTFFQESQVDLGLWARLLTDGRHIPAVGGSDAHQNVLPALFPDGDRGDSYRRVFRWFSNELLVRGAPTRDSALEALHAGRVFTVFEAFGTPVGFSFTAQTAAGTSEIGADLALADAPVLHVTRPHVNGLAPSLPAPDISLRVLRAEAAGSWTEVARAATGDLAFTPSATGVYRAEVRMMPNHARPYLPGLERLVREVPWVYSSAIYVH